MCTSSVEEFICNASGGDAPVDLRVGRLRVLETGKKAELLLFAVDLHRLIMWNELHQE